MSQELRSESERSRRMEETAFAKDKETKDLWQQLLHCKDELGVSRADLGEKSQTLAAVQELLSITSAAAQKNAEAAAVATRSLEDRELELQSKEAALAQWETAFRKWSETTSSLDKESQELQSLLADYQQEVDALQRELADVKETLNATTELISERAALATARMQTQEAELHVLRGKERVLLQIRECLQCPISHELCKDPVLATDGQTYDRKSISPWISSHGTSPITREVLGRALVPNLQCRAILAHLHEQDPGPSDSEDEVEQAAAADPLALLKLILRRDSKTALEILQRHRLPGVNHLTPTGQSLLHVALDKDLPGVALALIAHPEFDQINARDQAGSTVLHHAAHAGMFEVCRATVERKDFREVYARVGETTALKVAKFWGFSNIIQLLDKAELDYTALHKHEFQY